MIKLCSGRMFPWDKCSRSRRSVLACERTRGELGMLGKQMQNDWTEVVVSPNVEGKQRDSGGETKAQGKE